LCLFNFATNYDNLLSQPTVNLVLQQEKRKLNMTEYFNPEDPTLVALYDEDGQDEIALSKGWQARQLKKRQMKNSFGGELHV
jgi:hypothetical protein